MPDFLDFTDRLKPSGLEQLRDFFDRGDMSMILIGMPAFDRQLARYPQLYSRVGFAHQYRPLDAEDIPEVAVAADSGKLYVVKGALLEVRDGLTGRSLGDWVVPGLDERVSWRVSQGAALLAEERRVSVFELPA